MIPNKVYDILKWVCLVFIPALATLWFTISSIWSIPYSEQILGTLVAIETFLGALIGISNIKYKKTNKMEE